MNTKLLLSLAVIILFFVVIYLINKREVVPQIMETGDQAQSNDITVTPIEHATMVLRFGDVVIYTDPVGGAEAFSGQPTPDIILLTDIHGDHLSPETLFDLFKVTSTVLIAPGAVVEELADVKLGRTVVMNNGDKVTEFGISIEAVPMYNLPETADSRHPKGRGNGYVLEKDGKRIYISGDTADTTEMRNLQNIDIAYIAMNLPYTMSVENAASGVLAFKPRQVYPYHYRGQDGLSDLSKFKELVNAGDPSIEVVLLDWYPKQ